MEVSIKPDEGTFDNRGGDILFENIEPSSLDRRWTCTKKKTKGIMQTWIKKNDTIMPLLPDLFSRGIQA